MASIGSRFTIVFTVGAVICSLACWEPASAGSSIEKLKIVADIPTCAKYFQKDASGKAIPQAQLGADCQSKFGQGLMLFQFDCKHCDRHHSWAGRFIVNGVVGTANDVIVSPQLDAAWTANPNAFKPSDCVSIVLTDTTAQQHPSYQSNALCPVASAGPSQGNSASQSNFASQSTAPSLQPANAALNNMPQQNISPNMMPQNVSQQQSNMVAGPSPAMGGSMSNLIPPSGLEFTDDPVTCLQHAAGNIKMCASGLIFRSTVFLIWDGGCRHCNDGYEIDMVDQRGQLHQQGQVSHSITVVGLSKRHSNGRCFTVRAIKAGQYSDVPQPICYKP